MVCYCRFDGPEARILVEFRCRDRFPRNFEKYKERHLHDDYFG